VTTVGSKALMGHFGAEKEPIVLTMRAAGGIAFGSCSDATCKQPLTGSTLTLGSFSDGFSSMAGGLDGKMAIERGNNQRITIPSGGASAAAALFDPPAAEGIGQSSATYRLTAGADFAAANPLAIDKSKTAAGRITVAGYSDARPNGLSSSAAYTWERVGSDGKPSSSSGTYAPDFADTASLVRTGTGDIFIAAAGDLVLQGTNSVIYTAGTGYNYGGTASQPLPGFRQYNGTLRLNYAGSYASSKAGTYLLPPAAFPVMGGDLHIDVGGDVVGNSQGLIWEITGLGTQNVLETTAPISGSPSGEYITQFYDGIGVQPGSSTIQSIHRYIPGRNQYAYYPLFQYFSGGVGALGGGDVSIEAGGSVSDIAVVLPTNLRNAGNYLTADAYDRGTQAGLMEQGGGALTILAGGDIRGVDSFVQKGATVFRAGRSIALGGDEFGSITTGSGDVTLEAKHDITIGDRILSPQIRPQVDSWPKDWQFKISGISIAQNANMTGMLRTYSLAGGYDSLTSAPVFFDTLPVLQGVFTRAPDGAVTISATGSVNLDVGIKSKAAGGYNNWNTAQDILPPQLHVASLQGDITNTGRFILYPDKQGTIELLARNSIVLEKGFVLSDADPSIMQTLGNYVSALRPTEFRKAEYKNLTSNWGANPSSEKSAFGMLGGRSYLAGADSEKSVLDVERSVERALRTSGNNPYESELLLAHAPGLLHANDNEPARLVALTGDLGKPVASVLEPLSKDEDYSSLIFAKAANIFAGRDIENLSLFGQNNSAYDITSLVAGRDILWDAPRDATGTLTGDRVSAIMLGGPGELLVRAGRDIDLGFTNGIQSVGNFLNPNLPSQAKGTGQGANVTVLAGVGTPNFDYAQFLTDFVNPATAGEFAAPLMLVDEKGKTIGEWQAAYDYLMGLPVEKRQALLNELLFDLVRDSGLEHTNPAISRPVTASGNVGVTTAGQLSDKFRNYERAYAAISSLLGEPKGQGNFRGVFSQVRTTAGGNITILSPTGQVDVGAVALPAGFSYADSAATTGMVTEQGGTVRIYANGDINVNQSRVFTLNGGDITMVSRYADIDAGRGAKTVQAVPPPTVTFDKDGNITIVPVGASAGSGIAVLRSLPTTPLGNADLVAFEGVVDAGDAGVRVSGNLNIAAIAVLNAGNIQVGGTATGVPVVQAPDLGALTSGSNVAAAATGNADAPAQKAETQPSIIIVEVLGYGGSDGGPAPDGQPRKNGKSAGQSSEGTQ
jgi:hypothetical protein